jgi:hypothetical protein
MNARLEQRVKKLESFTDIGNNGPRFIIIRGLTKSDDKKVMDSLTCNGVTISRLPDEIEQDFIVRCEESFSKVIAPNCIGMLIAGRNSGLET